MARQFCTFRLDGYLFGVPVEGVQEVLRNQERTVVPLAPPEVVGLLNLRGRIVTTLDLRTRLALPPRQDRPQGSGVDVVVRVGDGVVSFLVDEIGDVLTPPDETFDRAPETVPAAVRALVTAVCKLDGELMLVLDTDLATAVAVPAP